MNELEFLKENLSQAYSLGSEPGLCVCLPNSTAVLMSEGKSISSDFLRLGRIRELGVPVCSFRGLEQHWEPIKSIKSKSHKSWLPLPQPG